MKKLSILLGAGVGYVLGTRDGRERYEQIRQQAQKFWNNPKVQEKKEQVSEVTKPKGGELQDKAFEKVGKSGKSDKSSTETSASSSAGGTTSAAGTSPSGGTQTGPRHA